MTVIICADTLLSQRQDVNPGLSDCKAYVPDHSSMLHAAY